MKASTPHSARRRANGAASACLSGLLLSSAAIACEGTVEAPVAFDSWDYSDSVKLDQFAKTCSTRFPALAPVLKDQQARLEALEPGLAKARLAASKQPEDLVEKLARQARTDAEQEFAKASRESDPERFCRWHLEDRMEVQSVWKHDDCEVRHAKLPDEQYWALFEALQLRRVAALCRRESPALGERAEKAVAAWELGKPVLIAARGTLAGLHPYWIDSGARMVADAIFGFQLELHGAEAACGDVVGNYSKEGREAAEKKHAAEAARMSPYDRALTEVYARTLSARVLASMCPARYPDTTDKAAVAVAKWNRREARFIAEVDAFVASRRGDDAFDHAEEEMEMRRAYSAIMKRESPEESGAFCRSSLEEIASGSWRTEEPQLFQTLSSGRPAD